MLTSPQFWLLVLIGGGLGGGYYYNDYTTKLKESEMAVEKFTSELDAQRGLIAQKKELLQQRRDTKEKRQMLLKAKDILDERLEKINADLAQNTDSFKAAVENARASAAGMELGNFTLTSGKLIQTAKIRKVDESGISMIYADGVGTVEVDLLPENLKEKYDLGANALIPKLIAAVEAFKTSPPKGMLKAESATTGVIYSKEITAKLEVPDFSGKKVYQDVQIMDVTAQGVSVSHDGGLSLLAFETLPKDWLAKHVPTLPDMAKVQTPPTHAVTTTAPSPASVPGSSFDASCLIIIKTDIGSGSGFIAQVNGKAYVYTNAHVICGTIKGFTSKIVSIKTASGRNIPVPYELELSNTYDAASTHGLEDVARFPVALKEGETAYALADTDFSININQRVTAYGNSLGADAVTSLDGSVLGLGTDRVEISCEIVSGNSGGPVVLTDTKRVIGISTYLNAGKRDIWSRDTVFEKVRRFAVRPDKVTHWRKMQYTSLMSSLAELKAFDRDTLTLAAACFLDPKPNRGGFDVPSRQRGDYIIRQVITDGSRFTLGATISSGITKVNQRLGAAKGTMAIANVVPVFSDFFSSVAQASSSQISMLSNADRAPFVKQFIPEMLEIRKAVHASFLNEGATRYR